MQAASPADFAVAVGVLRDVADDLALGVPAKRLSVYVGVLTAG
jgi:hypothetical protein